MEAAARLRRPPSLALSWRAVEALETTEGIIALAAAAAAVVAVLLAAWALICLRRLRADQRAVLGDGSEQDLVRHAAATADRVDGLEAGIEQASRALLVRIEEIEAALERSVAHTSVVRYDAFNETSGRQSSSVAILDRHGDGLVLSAILQREQARVYAKALRGGRSELQLSPEEREAIGQAQAGRGEGLG